MSENWHKWTLSRTITKGQKEGRKRDQEPGLKRRVVVDVVIVSAKKYISDFRISNPTSLIGSLSNCALRMQGSLRRYHLQSGGK